MIHSSLHPVVVRVLGPEEAGEFAGDSDGHDGRALALRGEVAVAVKEADLRLPGAIGWLRAAAGSTGRVAVVPGGLYQQPAGVVVVFSL